MKNASILYQQKPIPQQSIFCLIRDINNYVEINIYWSYIHFVVRIDIFPYQTGTSWSWYELLSPGPEFYIPGCIRIYFEIEFLRTRNEKILKIPIFKATIFFKMHMHINQGWQRVSDYRIPKSVFGYSENFFL